MKARTYTQLQSAVKSYQVPCSYTYSESDLHALVCTYVVGTSWIFNFLYVNKTQSTIATHQSQLELNHKHQFRKGWKVEVKECKYCHSTYCFHLSLALLIKLVYASKYYLERLLTVGPDTLDFPLYLYVEDWNNESIHDASYLGTHKRNFIAAKHLYRD